MSASCPTQLLQPDTSDDATHRKAKQIHLRVVTPATTDVIVELLRQGPEGNSAETMRKMGNEQRNVMHIQTINQTPKKMRRIPKPMNKNQRTPRGWRLRGGHVRTASGASVQGSRYL